MKITIGADHGGFELKQQIIALVDTLGHQIDDVGCHSKESVDYPEFAEAVCQKLVESQVDAAILVCGTGIGMAMAANRHKKVRAAVCHDEYTARMSREHNNANILCLGARVIGPGVAEEIVKVWLKTDFAGGRHQQRIAQYSD